MNTLINTKINTRIPALVQQGTALNFRCDTTLITADSSRRISVNGVNMTIREYFTLLNAQFTTMYNSIIRS
jgi:hypothetical protein